MREVAGPGADVMRVHADARADAIARAHAADAVTLGADVYFRPDGDGTIITWGATFEPLIPGTGPLLAAMFRRMMGGFARRLAAYGQQHHSALNPTTNRQWGIGELGHTLKADS